LSTRNFFFVQRKLTFSSKIIVWFFINNLIWFCF
jgi:hypothetical protein